MKKRFLALLLALNLLFGVTAFAADRPGPPEMYAFGFQAPDEPVDKHHGSYAYRSLNSAEQAVYDVLKEDFLQVAKGNRDSSSFKVDTTGLGITVNAKGEIVGADVRKIMHAIRMDFPCEAYWQDKVSDKNKVYHWWDNGRNVYSLRFDCPVLEEFAKTVPNANRYYLFKPDPEKIRPIANIILNVREVVRRYSELSDYDKLAAYRDYLCDQVVYDHDAIKISEADADFYSNSWQFVYAFDNDPKTNIVCEGYAKAFKYLCDQSKFDNEVECYLVNGLVEGGPHMWNLVRINGKSFMADITWCDSDWGRAGDLFLAGTSSTTGDGFAIPCFAQIHPVTGEYIPARTVHYTYWDETKELYDSNILTLESFRLLPSNFDLVKK